MNNGPYKIIVVQVDFSKEDLESKLNAIVREHPSWRLVSIDLDGGGAGLSYGSFVSPYYYNSVWIDLDTLKYETSSNV